MTRRTILASLLALATILGAVMQAAPAFAHGERNQEPFLRMRTAHWYDVKFSTESVAVNDTLTLTGKFRMFPDWPQVLPKPETAFLGLASPGAALTRVESYINGVPAIQSTRLELGRDYEFKIVMKGRIPGRHHIHPLLNVKEAGPIAGPGEWIEISGNLADFRQPATTLTGVEIANLENWGVANVVGWHIAWIVVALLWLLWWLRRPLLIPRHMALQAGRESRLVTRTDRMVAAGFLAGTLLLVGGGFFWAEAKYPNTIPLQGGRVVVEPLPAPAAQVTVKTLKANYDVPGRSMRMLVRATNNTGSAIRIGEFTSANLRFVNATVPAAVANVDPTYPEDLIPKSGLRVEPDQPIQPGEAKDIFIEAADVAWETERLTSLMKDPDSTFGALLFFYDDAGGRHLADVSGTIVPTFVK